jgi:hypothetical protein
MTDTDSSMGSTSGGGGGGGRTMRRSLSFENKVGIQAGGSGGGGGRGGFESVLMNPNLFNNEGHGSAMPAMSVMERNSSVAFSHHTKGGVDVYGARFSTESSTRGCH